MARGTLNHKNTLVEGIFNQIEQICLLGFTIHDVYKSPKTWHKNRKSWTSRGRLGGNVYFQKLWNLSSRQHPISPAVWCGNCTVMAFYVAVLRWLIIYTLHTPSPCFSNFSKLMTYSKHDGKLWPQKNKSLNVERKKKKTTTANLKVNPAEATKMAPLNQVSCKLCLRDFYEPLNVK